ncbi:MAG: alpha/beta hydrolase [Bacteroidetes bacterium 43-93]|nr:alpha/beta hydrolase [Bacteroidota bacterium]OJW98991.1 MAG: alpha/beta hydrolase [Bacteroidetes bacterium 43-93]
MEHILLLHGAIGAKDQLQGLSEKLSSTYNVHNISFSGHGGTPYSGAFSIKQFAEEVLAYVNSNGLDKVNIFGYSMGGYVGMYLARYYPERINKLVTLATKYHWDPAIAEKENKMLDADVIASKIPVFAAALEKRHAPNNWKDLLLKTRDMLTAMGNDNPLRTEDYGLVNQPILVLLGDRDKMVSLEEILQVYKYLPNAQMGMLPGTAHPIEQVNNAYLTFLIKTFISEPSK